MEFWGRAIRNSFKVVLYAVVVVIVCFLIALLWPSQRQKQMSPLELSDATPHQSPLLINGETSKAVLISTQAPLAEMGCGEAWQQLLNFKATLKDIDNELTQAVEKFRPEIYYRKDEGGRVVIYPPYDVYDEQILKDLIQQGDSRAAAVLGIRLLKAFQFPKSNDAEIRGAKVEHLKASALYLEQAIVSGEKGLLSEMAKVMEFYSILQSPAFNSDKPTKHWAQAHLEYLAWANIAAQYDDFEGAVESYNSLDFVSDKAPTPPQDRLRKRVSELQESYANGFITTRSEEEQSARNLFRLWASGPPQLTAFKAIKARCFE